VQVERDSPSRSNVEGQVVVGIIFYARAGVPCCDSESRAPLNNTLAGIRPNMGFLAKHKQGG